MIDGSIRAAEMLHALASRGRLAILAELAQGGAMTFQALADRLSLPVKAVVKDVTRLSLVGLAHIEDGRVVATIDAADELANELAQNAGLDSRLDEASPLRKYFSWGRLTSIPNDLESRRELAFLAATLIPVNGLAEPQVNAELGRYYDDHAELRRLMVDFGAATRDNHTLTYYPVDRTPGGTR